MGARDAKHRAVKSGGTDRGPGRAMIFSKGRDSESDRNDANDADDRRRQDDGGQRRRPRAGEQADEGEKLTDHDVTNITSVTSARKEQEQEKEVVDVRRYESVENRNRGRAEVLVIGCSDVASNGLSPRAQLGPIYRLSKERQQVRRPYSARRSRKVALGDVEIGYALGSAFAKDTGVSRTNFLRMLTL